MSTASAFYDSSFADGDASPDAMEIDARDASGTNDVSISDELGLQLIRLKLFDGMGGGRMEPNEIQTEWWGLF